MFLFFLLEGSFFQLFGSFSHRDGSRAADSRSADRSFEFLGYGADGSGRNDQIELSVIILTRN